MASLLQEEEKLKKEGKNEIDSNNHKRKRNYLPLISIIIGVCALVYFLIK